MFPPHKGLTTTKSRAGDFVVIKDDMKLVMQTKQWSCAHACIAMLKDIPEQEVIDKFPRALSSLLQIRRAVPGSGP